MKKLDLHIHTKQTISDDHTFVFSLANLKEYVQARKIDGIAITNHNMFDIVQFKEIQSELTGLCEVLPGIEINLGIKGFGHMLCIANPDEVDCFADQCKMVEDKIKRVTDKISVDDLTTIFFNIKNYLLIPHYEKTPIVEQEVLVELKDNIICGETGSIKKFIYCQKNADALVPVLFSDYRPSDTNQLFPIRQTYFDIDEISIQTIKKAIIDRKHVSLTEEEGNSRFYVLPDLPISTGLNVVIGGRSSGKTYTLDLIEKYQDNIKYIKQFELIERDTNKAAKEFADRIAKKRSSLAEEYLEPFSRAVDDVKNISLEKDNRDIDNYLSSLIMYAKERDRKDAFAKCRVFLETKFPKRNLDRINGLIHSVEQLIEEREYRKLIDKHISLDALKALHAEFVTEAIREKKSELEENWVNSILESLKRQLNLRSASKEVVDVDFYDVQMNRVKVDKFNKLVSIVVQEAIIDKQEVGGFYIQTQKRAYGGASELKNVSGKKNVTFSQIFNEYASNPFQFLLGLKDMPDIAEADYYKFFVYIEYAILNKYGASISGGERAEFKLLEAINNAYRYDMLLIDEPESSFDNIFLKQHVNYIIKKISENMPVILVTHNNTVGASIKPDYIVYTKRITENEEARYERYYGLPSSKVLCSFSGEEIRNFDAILDCLEAGKETYDERKRDYEILED